VIEVFTTNNNSIEISRGRYGKLIVPLQGMGGGAYTLQAGEKLVLVVKKTPDDPELIHLESVNQFFEFEREHTVDLDFGPYTYDITLVRSNGRMSSIFKKPHDFVVMEVNYNG
jgi:hypothetical protein